MKSNIIFVRLIKSTPIGVNNVARYLSNAQFTLIKLRKRCGGTEMHVTTSMKQMRHLLLI